MTTTAPDPTTSAPATTSDSSTDGKSVARSAFVALLARDLTVLRRHLTEFVVRTVMQPLMLVFVLTYVFPKIRVEMMGTGDPEFARVLVIGIVALSVVMQGIQSVSLPLVAEFGYTREIEDRVLAPIPVWLVAVQKILSGALHSLFAALIVFPLAAVVPVTPIHLDIDWLLLLTIGPLVCIVAAAGGLCFGTLFDPRSVSLLTLLLLPLTFLGAVFFSWDALDPIPWLKYGVLVNPVVYMSEGLRAALASGSPHIPLPAVFAALLASTVVLTSIGIKGFNRRVEIGAEQGQLKGNNRKRIVAVAAIAVAALVGVVAARGGEEPRASCPPVEAVEDSSYAVTIENTPTRTSPFRFTVASDGQPVVGAQVCLESVMVDMEQMGAADHAREVSPGVYEVEPTFEMRGQWTGRALVTEPGKPTAAVPVTFDVR